MQFDSFKGTAVLRSLSYPGYSFVYSVRFISASAFYSTCTICLERALPQKALPLYCRPFDTALPCGCSETDGIVSLPVLFFLLQVDMKEFDSLYYGTGEANKDMMFMIA